MPAARMALALAANRNSRLLLTASRPVELAAANKRSDLAFSVVIDPPQTCLQFAFAGNDEAVSAARIWVNANTALKIQNPSRSKRF
jgi:hypothetical protein